MSRTGFLSACAVLVLASPALSQTGSISGTVTTAQGAPLGGAQVTIVGTGTGALTRDDGRYTVTVQTGTYTVRVTRIGVAAESLTGVFVPAGGSATASFQLQAATTLLSDVVVIGYGTQAVRDITGSIARVDTTTFNRGRIVSPEGEVLGAE